MPRLVRYTLTAYIVGLCLIPQVAPASIEDSKGRYVFAMRHYNQPDISNPTLRTNMIFRGGGQIRTPALNEHLTDHVENWGDRRGSAPDEKGCRDRKYMPWPDDARRAQDNIWRSFSYTGSTSRVCGNQLHARVWNDLAHVQQFHSGREEFAFEFQVAQVHTETFSLKRFARTGNGHDVKDCGTLAARILSSQMEITPEGEHNHRVQYGWGVNTFDNARSGCGHTWTRKITRVSMDTDP